MSSTRRFCAECGKTQVPLHENFCQSCYFRFHPLANPEKSRIGVNYCLTCGSVKLSSGWTPANPIEDIPEQVAHGYTGELNAILDTDVNVVSWGDVNWINPNPEFQIEYKVSSNAIADFLSEQETYILEFKLLGGTCKACIRKKTGSKDVIIQLRAKKRDLSSIEKDTATNFAFQLGSLFPSENPEAYLGEIIEYHGGLDFYFGNSMIAEAFLKQLRGRWVGIHQSAFKLITEDKAGKRVYSITHVYRLPEVQVGEFTDYNNHLYKVLKISSKGVELSSLSDQSTIILTDWKKLKPVIPSIVTKMVLSYDVTSTSYLLMDLSDYTTEEINLNRFPNKLPIGKEVSFIHWQDEYYVDPSDKSSKKM
ncbi:MAG: NMD3-related protein [Candidatus Kariarchaeaceae archaeon]|jgi:NMD protein affecting ribosome stability and mRNA decay